MPTFIHHIETAVPDTHYEQSFIRDEMKRLMDVDRRTARLLHYVYGQSGIDKRHSAIRDFTPGVPEGAFYDPVQDRLKTPGTRERNAIYTDVSKELYACAARQAVAHCPGVNTSDITHVVTVSCTGFFAPGPDYHIVKSLGLPASTRRFHVGFMGCYAAFPALKMAQAFCEADPDATVLVVCLELCTLHLKFKSDPDSLISASVFADGAAAALVSARPPRDGERALEMTAFATTLTPTGEEDMAWTVGDTGFDMVLSTYVPSIIEANLQEALAPLFAQVSRDDGANITQDDIDHWAIHPGGRAILDKVEAGLGLSPDKLIPSREVLRDYGNMSSATVLFILQKLLAAGGERAEEKIYAMAFGPGLTVESGLFTRRA